MAAASLLSRNVPNSSPAVAAAAATTSASVEEEKIARRKAVGGLCMKAAKIVFSTVGLGVIVALYAVAGAFIFQILEQTNEKEECIQANELFIYRRFEFEGCIVESVALLVARRNNNRAVVGSRPTKVVCITVLTGNRLG